VQLNWIFLLAAALCAYEGFRQLYRCKNVDRLEQEGKIPSDAAARMRKKPMWHHWLLFVGALGFLAKAFFNF
jgi:hypothetical protein